MRNFVISDVHGNGDFYYTVMSYLENISKIEEVTLYIIGDLIDRGEESGEILLDVMTRMKDKSSPISIVYLGGNHELMMHQVFEKRRKSIFVPYNNRWYRNGGFITDISLEDILGDRDEILKVADFISELPLYSKLDDKIAGKNIVLVHACCPLKVEDTCTVKIKDDEELIEYLVWTRKRNPSIPFPCRIGNSHYFSIVGHTYTDHPYGYFYDAEENYLSIDGGSAAYVSGSLEYDHFPLVEIRDNSFRILTFNHQHEIIYGNTFKDFKSIPLQKEELEEARGFLDISKVKKYIKSR